MSKRSLVRRLMVFGALLLPACGGAKSHSAAPATTVSVGSPEPDPAPVLLTESVAQATSERIPIEDDDIVWGSPTAPLTIVEFTDLQAPYCARVQSTLAEVRLHYGPEKLRTVVKHHPLPFHISAQLAAQFVQAVRDTAGDRHAASFMDRAYAEQKELNRDKLEQLVSSIGLDRATISVNADAPDVARRVKRDADLAASLGASGVPLFFVNGVRVVGAQPLEKFIEVGDAELEKAKQLLASGTARERLYPTLVERNYAAPAAPEEKRAVAPDLSTWKVPLDGAASIGPKDALVTIVAFYDYQCPFCKRVQQTLDELLARYPQDVRLVVRHNPLVFHPRARPAANLAIEARAQRGDPAFFAAGRRLFDKAPELGEAALLEIASELKLDVKRARRAFEKDAHARVIENDMELASDFEARGVPHFFVNGVRLQGAQPLETFVEAVERERERGRALVARGVPRSAVYAELMKTAREAQPPESKRVTPPRDPITRGPANAPIVIEVFSDFQCPFCKRALATMAELDRKQPGKIRWIFRHLPLPFHAQARPAAVAAMEARAQRGNAGFWAMHDALFEAQGRSALDRELLLAIAGQQKLDLGRFKAALDSGVHDAAIDEDLKAADLANITGTPAFLINGLYLSGAQPLSAFEKLIRYAKAHPRPRPKP